jgi:hypothetical protein
MRDAAAGVIGVAGTEAFVVMSVFADIACQQRHVVILGGASIPITTGYRRIP